MNQVHLRRCFTSHKWLLAFLLLRSTEIKVTVKMKKENSTLSPSSTSQIFSSVAGLKTANFLPLTESCHSLFINICRGRKSATILVTHT